MVPGRGSAAPEAVNLFEKFDLRVLGRGIGHPEVFTAVPDGGLAIQVFDAREAPTASSPGAR